MLVHRSGRFFSIDGIQVATNYGRKTSWRQPIIKQLEVGFLGFICCFIDGVIHFLVQAKIEPGNANQVQLSPTLQATKSNYTRVHNGAEPGYLAFFRDADKSVILVDQLQSEQGARFLRKRNRNMIIQSNSILDETANFRWMTLAQLKFFMCIPNIVNMDARTVISSIGFDLVATSQGYGRSSSENLNLSFLSSYGAIDTQLTAFDDILRFLTKLKFDFYLDIETCSLRDLREWEITGDHICHKEGKFFSVIGVNVMIEGREVTQWQQPMIKPAQEGICSIICKRRVDGIVYLLMQGKVECGNLDIVELAPTIQCLTGDYRRLDSMPVPFLDYALSAKPEQIIVDVIQSEEGGRFFHEQNRNLIILADDGFPEDIPENYIWCTLGQLIELMKLNNILNVQARCLIAQFSPLLQ
jgi:oxidase EvaA